MDTKTNTENQKRFVDAKKDQGLKRVILWARPEDVDALKTIARQPHSIAKLRNKVERELIKTMQPKIREKVAEQLTKKTRRAMLIQKRAAALRQPASSNAPPETIRFGSKPEARIRDKLKSGGWLYDPVAAVWHLPTDPAHWPEVQQLLDQLTMYSPVYLMVPEE
jgi:hypothetical protein